MEERKRHILVVDDDMDFREFVTDLLETRDFIVYKAENGKEGIEILMKEKIDIILTDMIMPEREGVETIMEVKIIHPEIKIIAMSGAMRRDTYLQIADGLGADATLSKPFRKQEMFDAIKEVCKE